MYLKQKNKVLMKHLEKIQKNIKLYLLKIEHFHLH